MEVPDPIKVRSQILHEKKTETDVYLTKESSITGSITTIEKKIHKHGTVIIHSLGAANYKALKIALMVQKAHPGIIKSQITTDTVGTNDFYVPVHPTQQREVKHREMNAVTIVLSRESP